MKTKIAGTILTSMLMLGTLITKAQFLSGNSPYAEINTTGGWTTLCGSSSTTPIPNALISAITGSSTINGAVQVNTTIGWLRLGPETSTSCGFYTSMPYYYFDHPIIEWGNISSYSTLDMVLQTGNSGYGGTTRLTIKNVTGNSNFIMSGNLGAAADNNLSQSGDCGLFWTDGNGSSGHNSSSGYVLAPYSSSIPGLGMRLDVSGNLTVDQVPTALMLGTCAEASSLNWATSYVGYNASRSSAGNWTIGTDGTTNGGATIIGDIGGNLRFINVSKTSSNGNMAQNFSDAQMYNLTSMVITNTGKVVIGSQSLSITTPGSYNLYVAGGILTEQVRVAVVNSANWADYVFGKTYKLKPLNEVEQYIKDHHHLPDVPSAADVQKDGVDMAQMDATLLKKIEELTLYVIDLKREHNDDASKIQQLEAQVSVLSGKK